MPLKESIEIQAGRETVWALIADPASWPGWNEKIQTVQRSHRGDVFPGERFQASFRIGSKVTPSEVEVITAEPCARLVIRQHYSFNNRMRSVDIAFDLESARSGTRITQRVDMRHTVIPWPIRFLISCIHRFGRPNGNSPLEELRSNLTGTSRQP